MSGVATAVAGGADGVELCSALELGGLTPSAALLARAVAAGLPVHATVRPRAGGFVPGPDELALVLGLATGPRRETDAAAVEA